MQVKQFWKERGWIVVEVFIYLSTTKGNFKAEKKREGKKESWTISGILCWFGRAECPSLLWLELRFQSPARWLYSLLLPQCLWDKMQLIYLTGVYSLTGVLRHCCDVCDRCLRGPEYLQSIVVSLNRCWGYMDYTRTVLLGLKVLHASFCSRCNVQVVCVTQSHRAIISTNH